MARLDQPLYFEIGGHVPTKKNSMCILKGRGGARYIGQTVQYQNWERAATWELVQQRQQNQVVVFPIRQPVNVAVVVYVKDRKRKDLLNLLAGVLDAIVKAGILADDCWEIVRSHNGCGVVASQVEKALVMIEPVVVPS